MKDKIKATKKQLSKAFKDWLEDWKAHPEKYEVKPVGELKPKSDGERCAETLIKFLNQ